MKIKFQHHLKASKNTLLIPICEADKKTALASIAENEEVPLHFLKNFNATPGATLLIAGQSAPNVYLLGLGEQLTFGNLVQAFRSFAFRQKKQLTPHLGISLLHDNATQLNPSLIAEAASNGLLLGTYDIGLYKTEKNLLHPLRHRTASLSFWCPRPEATACRKAVEKGSAMAHTQLSIFDLVNAPGNKAQPIDLANWAKASGKKYGYKVKVWNKNQIEANGFHALLAVNRGSEYPPSFIQCEYLPKQYKGTLPKIGLAGKGVTFDTGGLSIKGHANMHFMKSDMGGAAAVLGAMELCAKLQLPVHLIGLVPSTDNCVDAKSVKPGDVIDSYSGKTIEVIDTDAEGRLILADALAYLEKQYQPDIMIDLATLTGSTVRALGYQAGALFTNHDGLAQTLIAAGEKTDERLWRLPLWDAYKKDVESDMADVRNFSGRPVAGAISAAKFLEVFTAQHPKWAHLDIAGVAFG
ncbi:MAG: leucyl aminopeptidase, partial [Bacteroidota bacterium]